MAGVNPNNYEVIVSANNLGLRDADNNTVPDLAYITGSGAYDTIQLSLLSPTVVEVTISSYQDSSYSTAIYYPANYHGPSTPRPAIESYEIDLSADTDGLILIDAGRSNDLIEIDAAIPASFKIRGGTGNDQVRIIGSSSGSQLRSFVFEGEGGGDVLKVDMSAGDALPLSGFDFNFIGGEGVDDTKVIDSGGEQLAFFVNSSGDVAGVSLTDGRADSSSSSDDQITLRAAVQQINYSAAGAAGYIFLPTGTYPLTISGSSGDSQGDLDISQNIILYGTGAGASIIDGSTLSTRDRLFEVTSSSTAQLTINRVTLTGGMAADGGAIFVGNGSAANFELTLVETAIVANEATSNGGGVYIASSAHAQIDRGVFTGNFASGAGGGMYANGTYAVWLSDTVVAKNWATTSSDIKSVGSGTTNSYLTFGGNLITDIAGSNYYADTTDYVNSSVNYVVTSVVDTCGSNVVAFSLREAIDYSNQLSGSQTVWMPKWSFSLARLRTAPQNSADMDTGNGDIDILASLTIHHSGASIDWVSGVDNVFDLIGDWDNDGDVDTADYNNWTTALPNGDIDGDGDAQSDDRSLINTKIGKVFTMVVH